MTDRELLTLLHARIDDRAIRLEILHQGPGYTQVNIVAGGYGNRTGFEAMAYTPIAGEI